MEVNINSIVVPDSLHFFRSPVRYGLYTYTGNFYGVIGCFQVYNSTLSLFEIEILNLCPTMQGKDVFV